MRKVSSLLKEDWVILLLLILGFAIGAYFYPMLPDKVPVHWNAQGQVNGYGSKFFGAVGLPLINVAMYLLLRVLPYIDPKKKNYENFKSTYRFLMYLMIIFFLGMEIISLLIAVGAAVNMSILIQVMISFLFILLGNVMGRFKHNYFVGIKTPWTLASEEVWRKTHRLAAPLWVIGGIANIILALMGMTFDGMSFIVIVVVISVVPIVYSYFAYQKIFKK
jgi:uncharacterized membrane protein